MKIHILTVGQPKLEYAQDGWDLYTRRLQHYHKLRTTHVPDKQAYNADYILDKAGSTYTVALVIGAPQLTSPQLSNFLQERALAGQELCFIIGGPEGLPKQVIAAANKQWGLSELTFPHDLAMVMTAEALYRASSIGAGHPYHK